MPDITVMIVDDAEDNRMLQRMLLEEDYTVVEAVSGEDCIKQVDSSVPDLILLDVNMLGMNGYDTCIYLRKQSQTANIPIIFVSALFKPEERLQGYEAGANDYLTKPINGNELIERVKYHLESYIKIVKVQKQAKDSINAALKAFTYSNETNQVINFIKLSQEIKTLEYMGKKVCLVAEKFSLNACAYVVGAKQPFVNCEPDSLEAKMLNKVKLSHERITHMGVRTIIKGDKITLLIKNMPVCDESRYGRIVDHLAVLVSICDGRLVTLQAQEDLKNNRILLERVLVETQEKIKYFNQRAIHHDDEVNEIVAHFIRKLGSKLLTLGLDDDQESALMALAYKAAEKIVGSIESTKEFERELGMVFEDFYAILDNT